MLGKLLIPEIEQMIQERNFSALKKMFAEWAPADLADLISDLPAEDQVIVFRVLPHHLATSAFEYLGRSEQRCLLQAMGKEDVAKIINQMSPDDRTGLLEELPASAVKELLQLLSPKELAVAKTLLGYPERTVGRLMTPDFIAIKDEWTVQQVHDHIRQFGKDSETINVVYVLDDHGKLIDDVRIREFLLRPLTAKVADIRDQTFVSLRATESEGEAIKDFRKYDRTVLPVTDSEGKLLGIVTVDDILDVAEREATSDMQKMGGSETLDAPYLEISVPHLIRKRAPWLVILFLSEMLTATAMGFFEDEIAKAVVLAMFVPLIISSGGNSGSQATTLIIRAMALGEIRLRQWWMVMRREIMTGAVLGLILGTIGFVRVTVWHFAFHAYGVYWPLIATTIFFSLIGVVLWGSLSGAMLPFILRRCKLDPATCSAPFVATLVDVTGLIIYFTIALLVLNHSLLAPSSADVLMGGERTSETVHRLIRLNDSWEVSEVSWQTKSNRIRINVTPTNDLEKHTQCPKCGGKLKSKLEQEEQHWPYKTWFDVPTELVGRMPILKCERCGEMVKISAPPASATN
jgi:magnesium transporter